MTTSKFMMNLAWFLLFINWLFEWDMHRKFSNAHKNGLLLAALMFLLLNILGLLWTEDIDTGLDIARRTLPLAAIPLVILTSKPLTNRQWRIVAFVYVGTIFVVSIIGLVRYLTIPNLPYRSIVPYISHIRFSLNVCMAICVIVSAMIAQYYRNNSSTKMLVVSELLQMCVVLWFVVLLFIMQSYTGILILFAIGLACLAFGWKRITNKSLRWSLLGVCVVMVCSLLLLSNYYVQEYYTPRMQTSDSRNYTVNGNPYTHAHDGLIECGRYVNDYVCEKELRTQWPKVSKYPIDSLTQTGYPLYPALVRYLNAMGLSKDSLGVASLSPSDIEAIQCGVGNPVYMQKASLRRMFYVMLFEYENYRCYHAVKGFTMLQRIELWQNGWQVFTKNWIYGVGTGDVARACQSNLVENDSPLAYSSMHIHNQYISLLVAFGLVCLLPLAGLLLWGIIKRRLWNNLLSVAFFVIVAISFLSEDTLETGAGAMFVAFFYGLLPGRVVDSNNQLSNIKLDSPCEEDSEVNVTF